MYLSVVIRAVVKKKHLSLVKVSDCADASPNRAAPQGAFAKGCVTGQLGCPGTCQSTISSVSRNRVALHSTAIPNRLNTGANARTHQGRTANRLIHQQACAGAHTSAYNAAFYYFSRLPVKEPSIIIAVITIVTIITGVAIMVVAPSIMITVIAVLPFMPGFGR